MSKDKYKHAMEIIENWERVEIGFGYPERSWNEAKQSPDSFTLSQLNDRALFRIKPTPSKVPLGPEDIKPGMVFRQEGWQCGFLAPVAVLSNAVCFRCGQGESFTVYYEDLRRSYMFSLDGIHWLPCDKNDSPPPKREPRRVWVNYYIGAEQIGVMHLSKEGAEAEVNDEACEVAVEFVEVLK